MPNTNFETNLREWCKRLGDIRAGKTGFGTIQYRCQCLSYTLNPEMDNMGLIEERFGAISGKLYDAEQMLRELTNKLYPL